MGTANLFHVMGTVNLEHEIGLGATINTYYLKDPGGVATFLMEHMPKSTQRVDGCFLKFSKRAWHFFIRKIIGFQKIFSEGKLMNGNFS